MVRSAPGVWGWVSLPGNKKVFLVMVVASCLEGKVFFHHPENKGWKGAKIILVGLSYSRLLSVGGDLLTQAEDTVSLTDHRGNNYLMCAEMDVLLSVLCLNRALSWATSMGINTKTKQNVSNNPQISPIQSCVDKHDQRRGAQHY